MKKIILVFSVMASIAILSCNNSNSSKGNNNVMNNDSMHMSMQNNAAEDATVITVEPKFSNLNPGVSSYMHSMVLDYLAVKNALSSDNESAAAVASGKMYDGMKSFDKSLLNADQKKVYDDIETDLKENADHISKSKIDHQREHFAMMSKDMYEMVKAFGAGMSLYHDHCPMYKDGSMWLSETKNIRNPYYGNKMMDCGDVEEMMK